MNRINPKIDLIFKKLFGTEENKDILLSLINAILPEDQQVTSIILKNPYNLADYAEGKLSILDIKAEDENHVLYDIEMQIKGTDFYGKRTLYYWAKIFGNQLDAVIDDPDTDTKRKQGYSDLRKCIVISLMDFTFFDDARYHRCFSLKDRDTNQTHSDLDYLDLYFIELDKFHEDMGNVRSTLDRWISFLNNATIYSETNLPEELAEVKAIQKATEKLNIMKLNEQERQYYESQQRFLLDEITRQNSMEDKINAAEAKAKEAEAKAKEAEAKAKEAEAKAKEAEAKAAEEIAKAKAKAKEVEAKVAEKMAKAKEAAEKAKEAEEKAKKAAEIAQNREREIAQKLKQTGLDPAAIAQITGLSIAEIEKL